MTQDLPLLLCALHSYAFAAFHLAFWRLFGWKRELAKVGLATRAIVQILNLRLVYVFMGIGTGYVINVGFQAGTAGSYMSSLSAFASLTDLAVALVKSVIFGIIVLIVACQRGLETELGPKGVANAVNSAVVIGVIATFCVNLVITQLISMFLPQRIG